MFRHNYKFVFYVRESKIMFLKFENSDSTFLYIFQIAHSVKRHSNLYQFVTRARHSDLLQIRPSKTNLIQDTVIVIASKI